ncbi:DUF11 domain-containing protein [Micromonospora echinospora]
MDVTPQLDKAFSPATIAQGQTSTLTFTITNTHDLRAKNGMSFTDDLPAGVTATGVNSTTCSDATVTAAAGATSVVFDGDIGLGAASCTVSVEVTADVVGSYTNTGCAGPDGTPIPGCASNFPSIVGINPPGSATLQVIPLVDLAVTKTATPNPYVPGAPLTYTVTVTNSGPSDAVGATVTDTLPAPGFTWTCAASTGSTCAASGSGDISDTVTVLAGGTLTYTISGTVPSSTAGDLTNTAVLTPPEGVADPGCTPSCQSTTVTPGLPTVDLAITKTATPNPYVPGAPFTYTVTITNGGPSDAVGATVTDALPEPLAGFEWTCAAGIGSTCTASGLGDINDRVTIRVGESVVYTITGTVPAGTAGDLTNTATVTPPSGAADPGCTPNCSATVVVAGPVQPTPVPPTPEPPTPKPPKPGPHKPMPPLPVTGSGVVTIASIGLAAVTLGVLLVAGLVLTRRSRRHP